MKLRTLEQLEDALDEEMAWRLKELLNLRASVKTGRNHVQPMMIRAGVALLYAHWEGAIKAIARLYIDFVAQKRMPYDQLATPMLGTALRSRIHDLQQARVPRVHNAFADFILNQMTTQAELNASFVETRANLTSEVLRDITDRIGLPFDPYELRANLIDATLVHQRNTIAHGQFLLVDEPQFNSLMTETLDMLRIFRNGVSANAASGAFKA